MSTPMPPFNAPPPMMMGGYGEPPPPPFGVPSPVFQDAMVNPYRAPAYNIRADAQYIGGHPEYPAPGPHRLTSKQLVALIAATLTVGIFIGGLLMYKFFQVIVAVVDAVSGAI